MQNIGGWGPLKVCSLCCATSWANWEQLDIIIREIRSSSDKSTEFTASAIRGRHYVQAWSLPQLNPVCGYGIFSLNGSCLVPQELDKHFQMDPQEF